MGKADKSSSQWRIGAMLVAVCGLNVAACAEQAAPPLPASAAAAPGSAYKLGFGDKLRISVFGEPDLSGEFQVSGAGAVSMPLIGDVPAVGLSARELEAQLVQRLAAGYLKSPKVAVEVFSFRPFFILGEVERPGRYPSAEGTTLLGAIATAGGYTYRANTKKIFIRRAGEQQEHEVDARSNIEVQPGDVLRVGERYF
jgi:polysaccharide export outer membrane protein